MMIWTHNERAALVNVVADMYDENIQAVTRCVSSVEAAIYF
jgi:hypothetical protein